MTHIYLAMDLSLGVRYTQKGVPKPLSTLLLLLFASMSLVDGVGESSHPCDVFLDRADALEVFTFSFTSMVVDHGPIFIPLAAPGFRLTFHIWGAIQHLPDGTPSLSSWYQRLPV